MGRVTINGTIAQFSCKQSISKELWDAKGNRAKGKSREAVAVNYALDNIKAQITKHYQRLSDREAFVTAEMVRNAYQGVGTEYETLLRAFDKENEAFAKRVGKDRSKRTYLKYVIVRRYVAEFIKKKYKRTDIAMNELTEDFIRDYCLYLRNEVGLEQSSVCVYSIPLKHIVTAAHYNGKIARNPFAMYHLDPDHKERGFLTEDEIQALSAIKLDNPNFALARDLFLFGCWTGISFTDIKNLTTDNIIEMNGASWIVSKRQKTGIPFQIKLMDIPMQIIKRHEAFRTDKRLFNIGSLDMVNRRIKKDVLYHRFISFKLHLSKATIHCQKDENPALFSVSSIKCRLAHCPHSLSSFGSLGIGKRCFESRNYNTCSNPFIDGFLVLSKAQQGVLRVTRRLFGYYRKVAAARYVLSYSKPFGLLPESLAASCSSEVGQPVSDLR